MMSPLKFITCPLEMKVELLFPVTFPGEGEGEKTHVISVFPSQDGRSAL